MHRNYLTFRRSTHISQKLPENYLNRMQEFLYYNIKFIRKYDFELNAIANMPPCTIGQKIESKKVNIRAQGQEIEEKQLS